ncbi:MAG: NTP transferase domain-containing protein [Chloroflexota bacterium]|nr:NTP transferase domain-containing protein [Chloroflexota bacterium]
MNVGAIVLAAGTSSRMGRPKLLLPLGGTSLVRRAVETAVGSRAKQVVVVTGAHREQVERELAGLPVGLAHNPDFAAGMSGSLRAGLLALRPETDAAVVLLADQPFIGPEVVDALIEVYAATRAPVVRPRYAGQPGNPVLWDRSLFGQLLEQRGDQGGRELLRQYTDRIAWRELPDARAQEDVDTPEAYETLLREFEIAAGPAPSPPNTADHGHGSGGARFCSRCGQALVQREIEGRARPVCPACDTVAWADPKVAVAVVIPWQGGILLGRRAIDPGRGRWSFPSGYVDRGEVLEEAARREVLEEIGLDVRIAGLVGAYSAAGNPVVLIVYAGEVVPGQPIAGPEVDELRAFAPDALPDMAFSHDDRIVRDWLALRARAGVGAA